jgi:phosphatidylglycerophosphatase GEP4
VIIIMSGE